MANNFTAFRRNPRWEGKLFVVDVEMFKDGEIYDKETYSTAQPQEDNWPADLVKRRIENREGVKEMATKIVAGELDLSGLVIGAK